MEVESAEIRLKYVVWASCSVLCRACGDRDKTRNLRNGTSWKTKVTSLVQLPTACLSQQYMANVRVSKCNNRAIGKKKLFSIVFVCLERGNSWRIAKFAPRYGARHARTRHPSLSFPQGYLQVILWWNRKNPQTKNKGMIEMPTRDVRQQDMTSQPVWQVCKQQLPLGAAPSGNVRLQFRLSNFPFIHLFFSTGGSRMGEDWTHT